MEKKQINKVCILMLDKLFIKCVTISTNIILLENGDAS